MATVLWLHGGACNGNTMSFLNAEYPSVCDLVTDFGIEILWHPSAGLEMGDQLKALLKDILDGKIPLDIFVFEGTVIQGPNGTGRYNMFAGRPMKDWVWDLAHTAKFVVAVGNCACQGNIPAVPPNPTESTGLQFHKSQKGGFLGKDFVSKGGLPVINIPGCPAHYDWITQVLVALAVGRASDLELDEFNRPMTFFKTFSQTGCTRVQFFEWKIAAEEFGQGTRKGCLFYELGCRGPMTHAPCNRILWNGVSSKQRSGHPCLGCTEFEFPWFNLEPGTVFKTQKVAGVIPKETVHEGDKLTYMIHAAVARVAAPKWATEDMFVV
ncbi:MAG: hydrogenase [Aquificae bacterium]|nr:hydrogenase [Aquificota bacterium]